MNDIFMHCPFSCGILKSGFHQKGLPVFAKVYQSSRFVPLSNEGLWEQSVRCQLYSRCFSFMMEA